LLPARAVAAYHRVMDRDRFEQLVADAIAALPERLRAAMDNVGIVIEERVRRKKAGEVGIRMGETLLGLYEGVPKIARGNSYSGALPDKITIFMGPILAMAGGNEAALADVVTEVVWHEIGHHFGFDDRALRALERKRRRRTGLPPIGH
jgi:predicted Zn-dependent protease with MMP-like domain